MTLDTHVTSFLSSFSNNFLAAAITTTFIIDHASSMILPISLVFSIIHDFDPIFEIPSRDGLGHIPHLLF